MSPFSGSFFDQIQYCANSPNIYYCLVKNSLEVGKLYVVFLLVFPFSHTSAPFHWRFTHFYASPLAQSFVNLAIFFIFLFFHLFDNKSQGIGNAWKFNLFIIVNIIKVLVAPIFLYKILSGLPSWKIHEPYQNNWYLFYAVICLLWKFFTWNSVIQSPNLGSLHIM